MIQVLFLIFNKLLNFNSVVTNGGSSFLPRTKTMAPNGINNNNNDVINGNNEKSDALFERFEDDDKNQSKSLLILSGIFLLSLMAMLYIYAMFPELEELVLILTSKSINFWYLNFNFRSEKQYLKIPFDIEDAKLLGRVLDRYKELYYFEVMGGLTLVYIL